MYSLWLLVLVGAVITVIIWFWLSSTQPTPIPLRTAAEILTTFRTLLQKGAKGARVRFQAQADPDCKIDFVKYIKARNDVGFRVMIVRTPQVARAFDLVSKELDLQGIPYNRMVSAGGFEELTVDLGKDFVLAERIARLAFEQALGLSLARDIVGYYDLVLLVHNARLTGVDSPSAF